MTMADDRNSNQRTHRYIKTQILQSKLPRPLSERHKT
ncbi:hypothetical protein J2W71_002248 [Pseudomonas sp. 3400]|nr:hypothetical protein [Pseudomonas sp. 3400]